MKAWNILQRTTRRCILAQSLRLPATVSIRNGSGGSGGGHPRVRVVSTHPQTVSRPSRTTRILITATTDGTEPSSGLGEDRLSRTLCSIHRTVVDNTVLLPSRIPRCRRLQTKGSAPYKEHVMSLGLMYATWRK